MIIFDDLPGYLGAQAGHPAIDFQNGSIDPAAIIGMFQSNERLHVFFGDRYSIILEFENPDHCAHAHDTLLRRHSAIKQNRD